MSPLKLLNPTLHLSPGDGTEGRGCTRQPMFAQPNLKRGAKKAAFGMQKAIVLLGSHLVVSHPTWPMPWYLQPLMALLPMVFGVPAHLEVYVLQEVEVPGVHPKVLQEEAMR